MLLILLQLLIEKGADVSVVHKRGGTALIEAAGEGWDDIVNDLINKKADVSVQVSALPLNAYCSTFPS